MSSAEPLTRLSNCLLDAPQAVDMFKMKLSAGPQTRSSSCVACTANGFSALLLTPKIWVSALTLPSFLPWFYHHVPVTILIHVYLILPPLPPPPGATALPWTPSSFAWSITTTSKFDSWLQFYPSLLLVFPSGGSRRESISEHFYLLEASHIP